MSEPFTPLNKRQPKPKPVRTWWQIHSEEIGLLLWIFALSLAGASVWLGLDAGMKWFR
jgi:hypothetical protein